MKKLNIHFAEAFTVMGWLTLFAFIFYCTATKTKTDSVRDAWNLLFLIGGFVWGSTQQKKQQPGTATIDVSATATTETNDQ